MKRFKHNERKLNLRPQTVHIDALAAKRLTRVARAAGLMCASFVFSEPRLTPGQARLAQRIRRDVRLMSEAGQLTQSRYQR